MDGSQEISAQDEELLRQVEGRSAFVVKNKCDLAATLPTSRKSSETWGIPFSVSTSALTGEGIAELRDEILKNIGGEDGALIESGFLTNVRHQGLIRDSLVALDAAAGAVARKIPHEMLLMDLYNALRPLDAITGATTTDDILNLIFSTFCIGK
jgi:tRNA modification GTPase